VKKEWQKKALGELCDVIGGGTPSKEKSVFYSGHIPWATVRDMRQDPITETEFRITKDAVKSSSTNIIPSGSVVIATRVGLGKVCILGQDTAINQDLRGIIPRNEDNLEVRYLYWWFKSITDVIIAEGTGATVQGVRLPFVKSLLIPFPPLDEQKLIVAKLDKAFVGLAKAKENAVKNLQNARALFESHLQSVFTQRGPGWEEAKLDDVTDLITCGVAKRPNYVPKGIPFLSAKNVKGGQVIWNGHQYVSEETHRALTKNNKPKIGDILYTRVGSYGEAAIIERDVEFSIFVSLTLIKPKPVILNSFLKHYLNSSAVKELAADSISGSGVGNLNVGTVREFPIHLPPLAEQRTIVSKLDDLRQETQRLAHIYEQKLEALESLKKSILHEAFSGNL